MTESSFVSPDNIPLIIFDFEMKREAIPNSLPSNELRVEREGERGGKSQHFQRVRELFDLRNLKLELSSGGRGGGQIFGVMRIFDSSKRTILTIIIIAGFSVTIKPAACESHRAASPLLGDSNERMNADPKAERPVIRAFIALVLRSSELIVSGLVM